MAALVNSSRLTFSFKRVVSFSTQSPSSLKTDFSLEVSPRPLLWHSLTTCISNALYVGRIKDCANKTVCKTVGWGKTSLNDQGGAAFATPGQDPESFRSRGIHLISSVRTLCRGTDLPYLESSTVVPNMTPGIACANEFERG